LSNEFNQYGGKRPLDNPYKRNYSKNSYKNRIFNLKRTTVDEYTGNKVHYTQTGRLPTSRVSQTDHIVPLDNLKIRYKNSKIFTLEEVMEAANDDHNLAITNQHLNTSKGSQSNIEYVFVKLRKGEPVDPTQAYNMIKKQVQSEMTMPVSLIGNKAVKHASNITPRFEKSFTKVNEYSLKGLNAGVDVGLVTLTVSGINNLVSVASGEKELKDAAVDVAQVTGSSFLSGTGVDMMQRGIIDIAKKSGNKAVINAVGKGLPIAQITAAIMVTHSVNKYLNGELNGEECAMEILMNGAGLVAYSIGMTMGGPAGAVVASIVCSQICQTIVEYRNINKLSKEKLERVNSLAAAALIEMEYQRNYLKNMIDEQFGKWDEQFNLGFEEIFYATVNNDVERVASGLHTILHVFGDDVRFKTFKDFDDFFMDEDATLSF